ncbi:MAG TPA: tryptophan synthase subunit alpha, partial [Planctomycetota bacterium]|nr:tryptophan synthase subunit alpha [Planctomycetota bacterium]
AGGRRGVVPYVTAGDGGLEVTLAVLRSLATAGATAIEVGLPFSDPVADGPVLQAAAGRALERGTTLAGVLAVAREFRRGSEVPLILMTYVNPLLAFGLERAAEQAAAAGFDACLTVDLPLEESAEYRAICARHALAPIFFAAPTADDERLARCARASRAFLYAIPRLGVTGARTEVGDDARRFLARARRAAGELPLAVGFGLATPAQVRGVFEHADLAIVGSALVAALDEAPPDPGARARAAALFLTPLVQACP